MKWQKAQKESCPVCRTKIKNSKPAEYVNDEISRQKVSCPNQNKLGCTWKGYLSKIRYHLKNCEKWGGFTKRNLKERRKKGQLLSRKIIQKNTIKENSTKEKETKKVIKKNLSSQNSIENFNSVRLLKNRIRESTIEISDSDEDLELQAITKKDFIKSINDATNN